MLIHKHDLDIYSSESSESQLSLIYFSRAIVATQTFDATEGRKPNE